MSCELVLVLFVVGHGAAGCCCVGYERDVDSG